MASAYVFEAALDGYRGVSRRIAIRDDQPLTDLHGALQEAFGWADDHLYAFWLTGKIWDTVAMYTTPFELEEGDLSAEVPLRDLDLAVGQEIAYLFDFGDQWEVHLELAEIEPADDEPYPRIVASRGEAPPQYPDVEDE